MTFRAHSVDETHRGVVEEAHLEVIYSPEALVDLRQRLRRFDATRDPAALWPGLDERARVAAAREIERVTRGVLHGERAVALDPAGVHTPYALSIAGHTTGMGPLLGFWIETGAVTTTADAAFQFALHIAHARRRIARIDREVAPALDALLASGVQPVVLKGYHTAHAFFDEPAVRRMADVDLYIAPEQITAAECALARAGFVEVGPRLRAHKSEWIGPGVDPRAFSVEFSDARTKWNLELHTSLDRIFHAGAVARLDDAHGFVPFELHGRSLRAQSAEALLLTLACHCSEELGSSRLLRLVEIVRVIRAGLDWDAFLALLRRTNVARFTYPALALVNALAAGTVDARVIALAASQSTWAARHTVARLVPAGGAIDELGVLRQVMWMRGPLGFAHRALRLAWPWQYGGPASSSIPGWRIRMRQLRAGVLSFRAPDERQ